MSVLIVICAVVYTAVLFVLKEFNRKRDTILQRFSRATEIVRVQNDKVARERWGT